MWGKLIGFKDASFSVINFLSTTEKQLKWDADGLPSDQSAVKNAVLIDQVNKKHINGLPHGKKTGLSVLYNKQRRYLILRTRLAS